MDSHVPANRSSRTRLVTDRTPRASCSQGPAKGCGSLAPRADTLFRKCTTASNAAGPSSGSGASTLSRMPRKLQALSRDSGAGASERGSGRSCG